MYYSPIGKSELDTTNGIGKSELDIREVRTSGLPVEKPFSAKVFLMFFSIGKSELVILGSQN